MAQKQIRNLTEAQNQFKKELENMGGSGLHLRDVLDDMLFMASTAFRQSVHMFKTGKPDLELEQGLQVLKKRYDCPNDFGRALGAMMQGLEIEPHDFLGSFFLAIEAGNDSSGQFFTPCAVSETMARMTLTREHYEETIATGKRFSISEPAVGAGGMVIQCAELMKEWNAHPTTWYVDCTDIDIRCCRMAYVQLTVLGVPAIVRHGNTLSMDQWDAWETLTMTMNPLAPREEIRKGKPLPPSLPLTRKLVLLRNP